MNPVGTARDRQLTRYILTAQGCLLTGGHKIVSGTCLHCGADLEPELDGTS